MRWYKACVLGLGLACLPGSPAAAALPQPTDDCVIADECRIGEDIDIGEGNNVCVIVNGKEVCSG